MSYIKHRLPVFIIYLISSATMLAVAWLGGQDFGLFLYAVLLVTFFAGGVIAIDARLFAKRRKLLRELAGSAEAITELQDRFFDPIEEDWHSLCLSLAETARGLKEAASAGETENTEYFTLWVHQIKTPIAAMKLLLADKSDPVLEQEVFKIERYADMALKYVKLRDAGGDTLIERCELDAVISACLKKFALLFIYGKVSVRIEKTKRTLYTDKKWLSFIIEQALSNAVKYTPAGGSVSIYPDADMLVIEDTGIGIRPEDLPGIFEKGYTGCNGRLDSRASGIGLYLARKAAGFLDIELSASSDQGRGTRFMLCLPKDGELEQWQTEG